MLEKIYYRFHRLTSPPQERGEYSSGYLQDRIRREALAFCKGRTGRILEIGCGEGLFLMQLARQNPDSDVWGIDNENERLKAAEGKFKTGGIRNINLSMQDAGVLSFKDASFDTVVCINFILNLESIESVKRILTEMKRVCTKSGSVIFEFRNSRNMLFVFKYRLARYYDASVHRLCLNTYNPGRIETILKDLGLIIVNRRFIGFPLKRFAPVIFIEAKKRC